jgi:hypothetical protein
MSWTPRFLSSVSTFIQNFAPSLSPSHRPNRSFFPSIEIPSARYTACVCTRPSVRCFRWIASKYTIGYNGSSGRLCHACTSSSTASVTAEINAGETSVPYSSSRCPWISRVVMPRAYSEITLSSKPAIRR